MEQTDSGDQIHLAAACDENYAMPLAVMLASVAANLGGGRQVVAHVLESGLGPETKRKVGRSIAGGRVEIRWIPVQASRLAHHRGTLRSFDTVSIASYFRLLLPESMPDTLDRVIYLDCDLVVTRDIWPLWTADIGDTCLGAVQEHIRSARHAASRAGIRLYRELGLRPDLALFNSGVMVINLAKWRATHVASRAFNYLREARLYLRWHDQEALNAVVAGDWAPIDARWNVTMHVYRDRLDSKLERLAEAPYIVHYNAAIKPWQSDFRHARRDLFYHYLDGTAWAGWRPATPRMPALRRWAARLTRASRKARHAVGRRLQIARGRLHGWLALHRRPRRLPGFDVPAAKTCEVRVFITAKMNADLAGVAEHYLGLGADRVLIATEHLDDVSRRAVERHGARLHLFLRRHDRETRHEVLRQLLHRHGQGHWCVLVDDDEWLAGPRSGGLSLGDLRDYLDQNGYEALECQFRGDDGSAGHDRSMVVTASDPLRCRVFRATACVGTADSGIAEMACRSKVAMLRYRADLLIDRDLRGVCGARLADVAGVLLGPPSADAGLDRIPGQRGLARSTPAFDAFAATRVSRRPPDDRPAAAPGPRS